MFGLGQIQLIVGAILIAAVVGLGWYAKHETEQAGAERSARVTAEAVAANNAAAVETMKAEMARRDAAVTAANARAAAAARKAAQTIEEIRHAEDGPVAPALALAVERLRNDGGGAGDQGGTDHGAGPAAGPH